MVDSADQRDVVLLVDLHVGPNGGDRGGGDSPCPAPATAAGGGAGRGGGGERAGGGVGAFGVSKFGWSFKVS